MLIRFIQQSDKLLFAGYAMARERPKASPVQGEVAKIFDFCRRGCCRSKLPLRRYLCEFEAFPTQSLSQKSKIFDSSLYTREPWALPRQCVKKRSAKGNDTEHPPMVLRQLQAVVTNCPWGHPHKQQFTDLQHLVDKLTVDRTKTKKLEKSGCAGKGNDV